MNIWLQYRGPLPPTREVYDYLTYVEERLNFMYEHISTEKSMMHLLTYGTSSMALDINGQYQYVYPHLS